MLAADDEHLFPFLWPQCGRVDQLVALSAYALHRTILCHQLLVRLLATHCTDGAVFSLSRFFPCLRFERRTQRACTGQTHRLVNTCAHAVITEASCSCHKGMLRSCSAQQCWGWGPQRGARSLHTSWRRCGASRFVCINREVRRCVAEAERARRRRRAWFPGPFWRGGRCTPLWAPAARPCTPCRPAAPGQSLRRA